MRWIALLLFALFGSQVAATECLTDKGLGSGLRLDSFLTLGPSMAMGQTLGNDQTLPMYLFGRDVIGSTEDRVVLRGNAELRQYGSSVRGSQIEIDLVESKFKASGDVILFREGELYQGTHLTLKPQLMQGYFESAEYEYSTMNARGSAEVIEFIQPKQTLLRSVVFTTCPRERPAWELRSETLAIDQIRGVANGAGTVLVFAGVPTIPLGDISFPTTDRRRTGFLPPSYAANSKTGLEVATPFYWNIAPNRDATIVPKILSRRGLQVAGEFRYLGTRANGIVDVEVLPMDRATTEGLDRGLLRIQHRQMVGEDSEVRFSLMRVSDDDYLVDFGNSLTSSAQRALPALLAIDSQLHGWQASLSFQDFQLLRDPVAPLMPPYRLAPRISFSREETGYKFPYFNLVGGVDWSAGAEWSSFEHPTLANGDRLVGSGRISIPVDFGPVLTRSNLSLHATKFQRRNLGSAIETNRVFGLDPTNTLYRFNVGDAPGSPSSYSRVVPTVSIESKLSMERDSAWRGGNTVQTLEPRLLYVQTPFRDQSRYPVFDSAPLTAGLQQLFSERVYGGNDRIADQKHLTAALVSRVMSRASGDEILTGTIAQRYYLKAQRVLLPGEPKRSDRESDVLAELTMRFSPEVSGGASLQYTPTSRQWQSGSVSLSHLRGPGRVTSASYRYQRGVFDSLDLSFQESITKKWHSVGRFNYSFQDSDSVSILQREGLVEGLLGAEYDGGCWVGRVVFQKFVSGAKSKTDAVFFQVEFNGLGRLGNDPLSPLRRSIPGYTMINQIRQLPSRFENFQ